jgi:hypothetical protein
LDHITAKAASLWGSSECQFVVQRSITQLLAVMYHS